MALPGEVVGINTTECMDCGQVLHIQVLSAHGVHYIGFFCPNCGPYSRESGYYETREEAESAWIDGRYSR